MQSLGPEQEHSACASRCDTPSACTCYESDADGETRRTLNSKAEAGRPGLQHLFIALNVLEERSASPSPRSDHTSVGSGREAASASAESPRLRRPGARRRSVDDASAAPPASTGDLRVSLAKRAFHRRSSLPSAFADVEAPTAPPAPTPAAAPPLRPIEPELRTPTDKDAVRVYWTSEPRCYAYSMRYSRRASLPY